MKNKNEIIKNGTALFQYYNKLLKKDIKQVAIDKDAFILDGFFWIKFRLDGTIDVLTKKELEEGNQFDNLNMDFLKRLINLIKSKLECQTLDYNTFEWEGFKNYFKEEQRELEEIDNRGR